MLLDYLERAMKLLITLVKKSKISLMNLMLGKGIKMK